MEKYLERKSTRSSKRVKQEVIVPTLLDDLKQFITAGFQKRQ